MEPAVEFAPAAEVLAGLGPFTAVAGPAAWDRLGPAAPQPRSVLAAASLEEIALDRLAAAAIQGGHEDGTAVVGVGGGVALDAAKHLALRTGAPLVLVPTALSSLAPFTVEVARRVRRQLAWTGEVSGRVVVDLDLLGAAPAERNRAGAAEVVSTLSATWDWRLADARERGLPVSDQLVELGRRCRQGLSDAAADIAAVTPDGLRILAELLAALGAGCARAGHRRLVDGSEHTFVQSWEHRLGPASSYGAMVGVGTVAMSALQAWFGLSAGGPIDPADAVDLLTRCRVGANPGQLGIDEGTFRGVLRHTVRFAVGEFLPYSVLNEADVNWSASEDMWRWCWRVPAVRD